MIKNNDIEIEYVSEKVDLSSDPMLSQFTQVFEKFAKAEELTNPNTKVSSWKFFEIVVSNLIGLSFKKGEIEIEKEEVDEIEDELPKEKKISKKQKKKMSRLSIGELKQLVKRPDIVEVFIYLFIILQILLFSCSINLFLSCFIESDSRCHSNRSSSSRLPQILS